MIEAHATARYVRTSAQKAGLVLDADSRQGRQPARWPRCSSRARRSPRDIAKVLRSAIANAQQKDGFSGDVDRLFVSACYANQGPSQKRVRPAPMGRAFRVLKRTAHLTVHVVGAAGEGRRRSRPTGEQRRSGRAPRRSRRQKPKREAGVDQEGEGVTVGQKVHPFGFRLGFNKTWRSRWYSDRDYAKLLHEDLDAAPDPEEAVRARRRLEDRDRARRQQAEDRHLHLAARASSSAARGRKSTS